MYELWPKDLKGRIKRILLVVLIAFIGWMIVSALIECRDQTGLGCSKYIYK